MTSQPTNGHQSNGEKEKVSLGRRENAYNAISQYIPKGASGIGVHDFVPETGYREYWYPGVEAKDIGRKPVALRLLEDQIVFFRDTKNEVVALSDTCPHRGAFLSGGIGKAPMNDEFKGFITCPYHGYAFDGEGQCVAALTDGPDSKLAAKLRARKYPTRTLHGIVWIWMGVTEPVPLEEDLPPEFFEQDVEVLTYTRVWPMNWSLTMENTRDSHNAKIHRGGPRRLFNLQLFDRGGAFWEGADITEEGDNYICIAPRTRNIKNQAFFPGLGQKWPKHNWWRIRQANRVNPVNEQKGAFNNDRPGGFYMLPAIACPGSRTVTQHLRFFTPIDANNTRMFTFALKRVKKSFLKRLYFKLYYHMWYIYFAAPQTTNEKEDFPIQAVGALDPHSAQKLGATDAAIIFWRKKMPFKSRDAKRIWGKEVEETAAKEFEVVEEREAVEIPLGDD
jgi:phenylpropionate dioxygenase-like ring-hydroxylating dioxygenase large terminal subunit